MCPRVVVLLTFDRLSAHGLSWLGDAAENPAADVFRQLELSATFFEQHYSQDLGSAVPDFGTFGPTELRKRFQQQLHAAGIRLDRIILSPADRSDAGAPGPVCGDAPAGGTDCGSPDGFAKCAGVPRHFTDPANGRQFLWMHVSGRGNEPLPESTVISLAVHAGEVLRDVLTLCRSVSQHERLPVALIVTSMRGGRKMPVAPFQSQLAEDEVRVPLWLDPGDGQFCRVGAISGSFDVLPTVADLFGISLDWHAEADAESRAELTSRTRSQSLLPLCRAPGQSSPRILIVRTPSRLAVRNDHFLLVRSRTCDTAAGHAAASRSAESPSDTWLYVKPEDFWNVHDQAEVYQDVIPELSQYLQDCSPGAQCTRG